MSSRVGLVFDQRYLHHSISQPSPENPDRVRHLYLSLQQGTYHEQCSVVQPREVSTEQVLSVHSNFYLDQIRDHAIKSDPFSYDKDTYLMEDSLPTARLAAGGCITLADQVMEKKLDYGFAMIRPPGHHATAGRGMGFCVFNNIAIVAQHLRKYYGLNRILIVDFDVHHANGTQEIFYDSNEVLVFSIHQRGMFPFTGDADEVGVERGLGYSVNVPVHPQFGDGEYTFILGRFLQALCEQYMPQIILVSAGYDGHCDDTISQTLLTTNWFRTATHLLRQHAAEVCDHRLLFVLEGGYNPISLEDSVLATVDAMLENQNGKVGIMHMDRAVRLLENHPAKRFWTI